VLRGGDIIIRIIRIAINAAIDVATNITPRLATILMMLTAAMLVSCRDRHAPHAHDDADASPAAPSDHAGHAGHGGHAGHAADVCEKIGLTGGPGACLLFAHCGHAHFQIDCTSGGNTCACAGSDGAPRSIPYDAAFCALPDSGAPSDGLKIMMAHARAACGF
jgi:hypothetical protein